MKRFLCKLFFLFAAAVILIALCTSCSGNSFDGAATAYLNAFCRFDYKQMYDMLTPGSQGRVSYEEFVEYHKKVYDMLKIETVTVERGASVDNGNSKAYDYTATFTSSEYGTFTYEMQLEVYKKTKFYLIAWTPANVVTGMNWYDRIFSSTLKGKRGEIFDRDGRVIVQNDYAITVYAEKEKIESQAASVIEQIAKILNKDSSEVRQAYEKSNGSTAIFATMFKGELSQEQEDALLAIEGVKVDRDSITPIRYYPYGNALAQTLGYATPVTEEDRENEKYKNLLEGTRVGRSGLELVYDEYLQPENGMQIYLLSDDSKTKTVLYEKPARDGYDLVLTVDILLQKNITDKMTELYQNSSTGTANVVDPVTGAVRALVSYPSYDANIYAFDKATNYGDLFTNEQTPLLNRNVQGTYPPGSIFKSIMALIGLDTATVSTTTVFPYENEIEYYTYEKDRWRPAGSNWSHYIVREAFRTAGDKGPLTMKRALTWSDNIYFGWLAMRVGKENMISYAARIGIGESIPFDLSVKKSQLANSFDTLDSEKLLADTGFGQGEMLFAPLQLCSTFSLFGNGGTIMQPYIVQSICTTNEKGELEPIKTTEAKVYKESVFPSSTVLTVREILENTAKNGTGKSGTKGLMDSMRIAAKTGTAQTGTTESGEIGWYAGLVIEGGEKDAVLVSSDIGDLKFSLVNYIFSQLKDE